MASKMLGTKGTAVLQIIASILRPLIYSVAVASLGEDSNGRSFLIFVGYVPFFSVLDVLVQSYARWSFSKQTTDFYGSLFFDCGKIVVFLGCVIFPALVAFSVIADLPLLFVIAFVFIYALNSASYIYEWRLANNFAISWAVLLEVILSFCFILCLKAFNLRLASYLLVSLFPFCRVAALFVANFKKTDVVRRSISVGAIGFIFYSVASQIIAASAAALPAFFSQFTMQYNDLARGLIVFKIMLAASSVASMLVNVLGSRIFYGTIGDEWRVLEEKVFNLIQKAKLMFAFFAIFPALIVGFFKLNFYLIVTLVVLVVPVISIMNLISSLCLSRGLPRASMECQIAVFIAAIGVCCTLYEYRLGAIFSFIVLFFYMFFVLVDVIAEYGFSVNN